MFFSMCNVILGCAQKTSKESRDGEYDIMFWLICRKQLPTSALLYRLVIPIATMCVNGWMRQIVNSCCPLTNLGRHYGIAVHLSFKVPWMFTFSNSFFLYRLRRRIIFIEKPKKELWHLTYILNLYIYFTKICMFFYDYSHLLKTPNMFIFWYCWVLQIQVCLLKVCKVKKT